MTSEDITQPLLEPLSIGGLELPNRVIMAPMTRARAGNPDLAPTDLHATYYAQRASSGLIVTEGTWVSAKAKAYPNVPGIYGGAQITAWSTVADAVHAAGGRIFLQIGHAGARAHADLRDGELPAGPSAINPQETVISARGPTMSATPRAFTGEEIRAVVADYAQASANVRRAGFDGIEIHAHGSHLIGQFLNPRLNHRTDRYGGSAENHSRFLLEVVEAVNGAWDEPRTGVKLSPYVSNGTTFVPDDETQATVAMAISGLEGAGLAYLHIMGPAVEATADVATAEQVRALRWIRTLFGGVLVANTDFTRASANDVVARGLADAVSFGAPYIANPDLVERFATGDILAEHNPATVYGSGPQGYTDYPTLDQAAALSSGHAR